MNSIILLQRFFELIAKFGHRLNTMSVVW